LLTVRNKNREDLQKFLKQNGAQTMIDYPIAPRKQKAYQELSCLSFPISEKYIKRFYLCRLVQL
jgi:dTDP-4-amino-4,6-dideoxygalactose transaminase